MFLLDKIPSTWEERLVLFVGYLMEQNKQSSTIKSYISAIKAILQEDRIKLSEDTYLITSLTKACRLKNDTVRVRLPIHRDLLIEIIPQVKRHFDQQHYLSILYQSLFITAYYGMFRVGELTSGDHPILAKDVHIAQNKDKVLFLLQTSKMHWKSDKPQIIKISGF